MHALLDQFKKFSGVVKQMGGVKELFKDEKQVKNLNPQKMGKVCNSKQLSSYSDNSISIGVPEYGKGYGSSNVESYWRNAGD